MRVNSVSDHVTHAVISPNVAQSFGMSESAEFFNILSNSLYSDKKRAVIRETICNAWDAHIDAGLTDVPIHISLTKDKLVITDFGKGIPKDKMHPIYCIYGGSTKQNDGNQTGGFGLGCKAPFAYVDHFQVISCHGGIKTIYKISKSSGEVGGKPGLLEILSIPTQETGISVTIDIESYSDATVFGELIKEIVSQGEIKACLNDNILPVLPYSEAESNFLLTKGKFRNPLNVRYGNVVYPIPDDKELTVYKTRAENILSTIGVATTSYRRDWELVLFAEPHTIAVTPSRESLSMTDMTQKTLLGLLKEFVENFWKNHEPIAASLQREALDASFMTASGLGFLATLKAFPSKMPFNSQRNIQVTGSVEDVLRHTFSMAYPHDIDLQKTDILQRIQCALDNGIGNKHHILSFKKEVEEVLGNKKNTSNSSWFSRTITGPLMARLEAHPELKADRLLVYGFNDGYRGNYNTRTNFSSPKNFSKRYIFEYLGFLRNLVLITMNKGDVEERSRLFSEIKFWYGEPTNCLVYQASRKTGNVEEAIKFFKSRGFNVVDLTKLAPGEVKSTPLKAEKKPVVPRLKGVATLQSTLVGSSLDTHRAKGPEAKRTETPEFVFKVSPNKTSSSLDGFHDQQSRLITDLWGSRGAVVWNLGQYQKYIDAGAKDGTLWVIETLAKELTTRQSIKDYWPFHTDRIGNVHKTAAWMKLIQEDAYLSKALGIELFLNEEEKKLIELWRSFEYHHRYLYAENFKQVMVEMKSKPINAKFSQLAKKIEESKLVDCMNLSATGLLLRNSNLQVQQSARDLVLYVLRK